MVVDYLMLEDAPIKIEDTPISAVGAAFSA
jgi:hypothetical protein